MPLSIKDALRIATKDPEFAKELVLNPQEFKAQFHLDDAQIGQLKELAKAAEKLRPGLGGHGGVGPVSAYE